MQFLQMFLSAHKYNDGAIYFDNEAGTSYVFALSGKLLCTVEGYEEYGWYRKEDSIFLAGMAIFKSLHSEDYIIINDEGKRLNDTPFSEVNTDYLTGNAAGVRINGKYGYIRSNGEWPLPPEWDEVVTDHESDYWLNYIVVRKGNEHAVYTDWFYCFIPLTTRAFDILYMNEYYKTVSDWRKELDTDTIYEEIAWRYMVNGDKWKGGYLVFIDSSGEMIQNFALREKYGSIEYDHVMKGLFTKDPDKFIRIESEAE